MKLKLALFTYCEWFISAFTFTFMHLADAFIQSDLHCIQVTVFYILSALLSFTFYILSVHRSSCYFSSPSLQLHGHMEAMPNKPLLVVVTTPSGDKRHLFFWFDFTFFLFIVFFQSNCILFYFDLFLFNFVWFDFTFVLFLFFQSLFVCFILIGFIINIVLFYYFFSQIVFYFILFDLFHFDWFYIIYFVLFYCFFSQIEFYLFLFNFCLVWFSCFFLYFFCFDLFYLFCFLICLVSIYTLVCFIYLLLF